MLKTVFILMILLILVSFLFQVFVIYSTANTVSTVIQDSVLSIAAANMPKLYDSLREGNTYVSSDILTDTENGLLTLDALTEKLCMSLGLTVVGEGELIKAGRTGEIYTIRGLKITLKDASSTTNDSTLCFVTEFELVVPVAEYWNFGSMVIPMSVQSRYRSKF